MRALLMALFLTLTPGLAACQSVMPVVAQQSLDLARPSTDMTGREAYPMLYIDEQTFSAALPNVVQYPLLPWAQALECYQRVTGEAVNIAPPELRIVPADARTIRVRDMTLDSVLYAEDSTSVGGARFSAPTIGYTLMASRAVLVVDRYKTNVPLLRHEALHWIIWNNRHVLGHPEDIFAPCDRYYQ